MSCDSVDWMLLVQDGPEAVFGHDVNLKRQRNLWNGCATVRSSRTLLCYHHSCGRMENRNHSKSIIKENKMSKRFYWRICKEVRKCPQGVKLLALLHSQIFFLPAYAGSRPQSAPRFGHITCGRAVTSDGCVCSVATTACLYLVTPVQARGQPSLGSCTSKHNKGLMVGKEQTDVKLLWAQRSEVVSDYNLSLQLSVYPLVPIVMSSCLYLSVYLI